MTESPPNITPEEIPPAESLPVERLLETLPAQPGVYIMKDDKGKVIYVGKAANLRSRVRSYFRDKGDERLHVPFIRSRVADVETIVTDTEKEALLLENVLIKKHRPRYNIQLRDDKTYISLRLDTAHEWPRIHRIRKRRAGDKALYFGPFSSSSSVRETMRFLQRIFPLRSCPDNVLRNRTRPCVLYQIDRCCAPCVGLADREKYREYVDQTILFLNGKRDQVADLLRKKMWEYSDALAFEKAAAIRDQLEAIDLTIEKEKVVSHRKFDRDLIALVRERGRMLFMVITFRAGKLDTSRAYDFKDHGLSDEESMEGFLSQYYDGSHDAPRDLVLSVLPSNLEIVRQSLTEQRQGPVRMVAPQRGEKLRLLEMAAKNARNELEKRLAGEKSRQQVLENLQSQLSLPTLPRRIECFDISNFQGSFVVGSMTSLLDGEPDKANYRHFKVQTVEGQDDFASMREVLTRRYSRIVREGGELPDLIVIDGGKGQLNIAVEVLRELELLGRVPVCGLAKSRLVGGKEGVRLQLRTEERVFLPNRKLPVVFDQSDPALFILTRIRDEAHRFGVAYHRKLRSMSNLKSGLEDLPGIGPKKRKMLLRHFGSLARLREATAAQIAGVEGMNAKLAEQLWQFLHAEEISGEELPEEDPNDLEDSESDVGYLDKNGIQDLEK
ncbi:excinuclease ABC subunit UvrC [Candidatus Sumerlaeota bacterium]|nr:excinuclease ABC subunit UvrC [Candidatus Sumerlaeota bacterium]